MVLQGHTNAVTSVSVTEDGRRAVSGSWDEKVRVWNLDTGESAVLQGHTDGVESVSITGDGRRVVSTSWDETRMWNLETGKSTLLRIDSVLSVGVMAGGRRAVSGGTDRTVRVWSLATSTCLAVVRLNAPCVAVAVTRDNVIVAGTSVGEVFFLDLCGMGLGADCDGADA